MVVSFRLSLAAAGIATALLAGSAPGATPEPALFQGKGTIVFSCSGCPLQRAGTGLYTVSASGQGLRKLPTTLSPYRPRWSPKGLFVAFTHRLSRIAKLAVPNGRARLLTNPCVECAEDPAWSPDGRRIAFMHKGRLFTMRSDGTNERRLLRRRERGFSAPDWSPDGRRIAIVLNGSKIAVLNADGTRFRFIRGISARYPRWSPDGKLIAFIGSPNGDTPALMVMRPDGSGRRIVVQRADLAFNVTPAWSPDGRYLLFTVLFEYDEQDDYSGHEFLVAPLDGSPLRRIEIAGLPKDTYSEIYGIDWTRRALSS
jgi:Tol biopolymer transport system component